MAQSEKKSYHKISPGAGENPPAFTTTVEVYQAALGVLKMGLKPATAAVLGSLIGCLNRETGDCFPSITTIAADVGKSQITVRRAIADAEGRGLLSIVREKRRGRFLANRYELNLAAMTARMHAVPGGARGAGVQDLHPADGATIAHHDERRTIAHHDERITNEVLTNEDSSPLGPPPASRPGEPRVHESMCLEDALKQNPALKDRCLKTAITTWKRQRGAKPLPDLELLWEGFEDEWTLEHRKKLPDWPKVFLRLVMRAGDKRWCRQSPTESRAKTAVKEGDSGGVRSGWGTGTSPQARCGTVASEKWEPEPEKPAQPLRVHSTEDERQGDGMSDGEVKRNGQNPSRNWDDVPRPRAGGAFRDRDAAERRAEHARVDAELGRFMELLESEAKTVIKRAAAARPRRQWTMAELAAMEAEAGDIAPGAITGLPSAIVAGPVSDSGQGRVANAAPEISAQNACERGMV